MLNWEKYNIKIDQQASMQFEHYFNDLEKILRDQNLLYKKNEVFTELENHIIDIVGNKQIETITYVDSLKILAELGPPDEYEDFSTMPSIIDEINNNKVSNNNNSGPHFKSISSDKINNEIILCVNCNTKNNKDSLYCIQCGVLLSNQQRNKSNGIRNPFSYVLNTNPEYFFSLLTFFLLVFLEFFGLFLFENPYNNIINFLIFIILLNEFMIVPAVFMYRIVKIDITRKELAQFLTTYLLKIFTMISLVFLSTMLGPNANEWVNVILGLVIFNSYPIILTKVLFFTNYTLPFNFNFNKTMNSKSKIGYAISTIILVFSAFITSNNSDDLAIVSSFVLLFFVFVLYVFFDFIILSVSFNEKTIKKSNNSKLSYDIHYITDLPQNISLIFDKIKLIFLFCNIGVILLFIESIYLNTIRTMVGFFIVLFSIFIFIFVFVDFYSNYYYDKSSNVFLLTLGMYYFNFTIIYSYLMFTAPLSSLWNGPYVNLFYKDFPLTLLLFIVITGIMFPVLSILVLNNKTMKKINEISCFNNKIANLIQFGCYFILVLFVLEAYKYSIYLAGLAFLLGISLLLFTKPFFNLANYFMIYGLNTTKSLSMVVKND